MADVMKDGPSKEAGIQRGDIIREYDHRPVEDPRHLRTMVADTPPNTRVTINVLRDGRDREFTLTVGELPKDLDATESTGARKGDHALAGIMVESLPSGEPGIRVTDVAPRSSAERAGLRKNDILLEINRKSIKSFDDFSRITQGLSPNDPVLVLLKRGESTIYLSIKPEKS